MIAPVFKVCAASQEVRSLLGEYPVRLYPFGRHFDEVVYPYAVWQNIDGDPQNYLKQRPDIDRFSVQIDVYADTDTEVITVARALRDAIEGNAIIIRWGTQELEPSTMKYRYSFDVDWLVKR